MTREHRAIDAQPLGDIIQLVPSLRRVDGRLRYGFWRLGVGVPVWSGFARGYPTADSRPHRTILASNNVRTALSLPVARAAKIGGP